MKYKLIMMSLAQENLRNIRHHYAVELDNPNSARKICGEIKKRINDLEDMPLIYPVYDVEPWKSRGIRHFTVRNYIIYYKADEAIKTVFVFKIAHGSQSPEHRLDGI